MDGTTEMRSCGPGLCWFSLQRLPPLLEAFEKEIAGVRQAEDIEFIHRMRVASRRLRAALPLFCDCFVRKQYVRWMEEIATITRALGEARDMDVQITFLQKYRKNLAAAWNKQHPDGSAGPAPLELALGYLLDGLQKQRQHAQVKVIAALDDLEKSGVLLEMHSFFSSRGARVQKTPPRSIAYGIPTIAAFRIAERLAVLRAFEPWVMHADAVAEHHAMRIAAKKLRYTMEVYGPVYQRGLKKPHARIKQLQEILGDLHDCDVWIDLVTRLLLKERGRMRSNGKRPDTSTLASLTLFLRDRERERRIVYHRFKRYWKALEDNRIWDDIDVALIRGRVRRFVPRQNTTDPDLVTACGTLAAASPEWLVHHQSVTRLSLMIFDGIRPLHQLSPADRCLLECAGMVHDIRWTNGRRQHNLLSAMRVCTDESLPLDITERSMIGLIASTHRGKRRMEQFPLFRLLPPERQDVVLRLAAILKIADGLDCIHTGAVQNVRCTVGDSEVLFEIVSSGIATREKEKARSRSGLFRRMFGRELVIR